MTLLPEWLIKKLEKALKKLVDKLTPPPLIKYYIPNGSLIKSSDNAGYDLASLDSIIINPGDRVLVNTGLIVELPYDYELQIRPRSGLANKNGITVLNTPATIDPGYRGEIKVILYNSSSTPFYVEKGMRVAQCVFRKLDFVNLKRVQFVSEINVQTERGDSGFGSTGLK